MAVDVTVALPGGDPGRFLKDEPDEALAALARSGNVAAFEALYDRHHRGLIAFCRHMLGSREEAEDALQHTFAAAYRALMCAGDRPDALKAWLYAIARNRCLTVLRARRVREAVPDPPADGMIVEGLSDAVQRRADLRDLVADLHRLPEDQRAALVLFELGDHSHAEIAVVLEVDRARVKALVFQAREGLLRARTARDTPCAEIRRHLSSRTRALPRRGVIRGHLESCASCAAFDLEVRRQRAALAIILPVVPSLELRGSILAPLAGGGATVAGGGAVLAGSGAGGAGVTAATGLGATGVGAGAATLSTGAAGTIAAGGAAAGGLGALAAKALVAKVVTAVAVAGAAGGGAHHARVVHRHHARPAVTIASTVRPNADRAVTGRDPAVIAAPRPRPGSSVSSAAPAAAAAAAAPTAAGVAVPASSVTPAPAAGPAGTGSNPATAVPAAGGAPAADPAPASTNAPAGDPPPGDPAATPATPPATTSPPADPAPATGADSAPPATADAPPAVDPGAADPAVTPTATPACPAPVDPAAAAPDPTAPPPVQPDPCAAPAPPVDAPAAAATSPAAVVSAATAPPAA